MSMILVMSAGAGGAVTRPGEQAGVVEMGVGEQDGVQFGRLAPERLPVAVQEVPFLVKPAVHEELEAVCLYEIPRAGDAPRRAHERKVDVHSLSNRLFMITPVIVLCQCHSSQSWNPVTSPPYSSS